jgi:UDP-N-acetylglucosamine diphosphorylase/glucosamine-1-phosphate N-acetyltransferase
MAILLSDAGLHRQLLPLTWTRPVGALRCGMRTIAEGWSVRSNLPVGWRTEPWLQGKFPGVIGDRLWEVHGGLLPQADMVDAVLDLVPGQVLVKAGRPLAYCEEGEARAEGAHWAEAPAYLQGVEFPGTPLLVERPWHLFLHAGAAIREDFVQHVAGRRSAVLSASNTVVGDPALVFLEEGARAEASVFNTLNGPIHLGPGAEVMEGCLLRGPLSIGAGTQLKMGAKIYGPCAFGPQCRVGGEVNNSVILGFSNKGHDGFLGQSVLGEWCNIGADTNTSNLKNTYGEVKAWSGASGSMEATGQQFLGTIVGDHAKCGINTMFNTGTVVGPCSNVFGAGFPPKHVPAFAWGGAEGFHTYALEKALADCAKVMERRQVRFTEEDGRILRAVFQATKGHRA